MYNNDKLFTYQSWNANMLRMLGLPGASWAKQVPSYLFLHLLARHLQWQRAALSGWSCLLLGFIPQWPARWARSLKETLKTSISYEYMVWVPELIKSILSETAHTASFKPCIATCPITKLWGHAQRRHRLLLGRPSMIALRLRYKDAYLDSN